MENSQNRGEIVIYQPDEITRLEVRVEGETVWLTQSQMADLFGRDRTVITKHIRNIFAEQELVEGSNVQILHFANSDKPVKVFSLDIQKHNSQYTPVTIVQTQNIHDRFLIVDDVVYHIGASLKDLGKKLFAFSKMCLSPDMLQ